MIAISAASGALGRLVIDHLRARTDVVAVVRDPERAREGVPALHGDYDDLAGLRTAFEGVDVLGRPAETITSRLGRNLPR
ncbi:NAD(P)H-binding protein [Nonomuraea insulae]|uniref:NAD(P)H-binding protein n=1 Tax=Nonomuraea insulae TaxID=1616787 RepID=A0ABW1CZG4_9ACTN